MPSRTRALVGLSLALGATDLVPGLDAWEIGGILMVPAVVVMTPLAVALAATLTVATRRFLPDKTHLAARRVFGIAVLVAVLIGTRAHADAFDTRGAVALGAGYLITDTLLSRAPRRFLVGSAELTFLFVLGVGQWIDSMNRLARYPHRTFDTAELLSSAALIAMFPAALVVSRLVRARATFLLFGACAAQIALPVFLAPAAIARQLAGATLLGDALECPAVVAKIRDGKVVTAVSGESDVVVRFEGDPWHVPAFGRFEVGGYPMGSLEPQHVNVRFRPALELVACGWRH